MAHPKTKADSELGAAVHAHLVGIGLETPMIDLPDTVRLTDEEKIDIITHQFTQIMEVLGLDLTDDSLTDTPSRVAKMYVREIFWGLDYNKFPKATTVQNKMQYDEMVVERNVNVQSNCEHHFVVIDGSATVAYIPNEKVLGLSKINRIVEFFSKRPQIQERLTEQVYHALAFILETPDVAVVINATHYCVKSRGIQDTGSSTVTSKLGGSFKTDPTVRSEFMNLIKVN